MKRTVILEGFSEMGGVGWSLIVIKDRLDLHNAVIKIEESFTG